MGKKHDLPEGFEAHQLPLLCGGFFEFSSHLNILVGANAAGKTSVAEAVHCLGFLKSHKASDQDLIRHGETFSVVKGSFEKGEEDYEIVFSLSPEGKRIQANKKSFRLLSEYLGFLHVVFSSGRFGNRQRGPCG